MDGGGFWGNFGVEVGGWKRTGIMNIEQGLTK